jgi:hypothetical protein
VAEHGPTDEQFDRGLQIVIDALKAASIEA